MPRRKRLRHRVEGPTGHLGVDDSLIVWEPNKWQRGVAHLVKTQASVDQLLAENKISEADAERARQQIERWRRAASNSAPL